jgi:putative isomerase
LDENKPGRLYLIKDKISMPGYASLNLLRDHIDITQVPFSDRGSRLLVFQSPLDRKLQVKLAERLTNVQPDIEAYLKRPPFIDRLCFIDQDGEVLDFTMITYPHLISFQTRLGIFRLAFQDERTLSFGIPNGTIAGIRFTTLPQYWEPTAQGGLFRSVRNLTYLSSGQIVRNQIQPEEGGYQVEIVIRAEQDNVINIAIHPSAAVEVTEMLPFSTILQVAEKRWEAWFKQVPPVKERYLRTYSYAWWVMGNNLISPLGHVSFEAMMPSKLNYVGLWLWDSALHALAFRYCDPLLARNQIRAVISHQLPNGMLPDAVYDEGLVFTIDHPIVGEVTKPPILSWAALKLHETHPDVSFLREIYPAMIRCNAWWFSMNDDDSDGLVQYTHPYSSGLDDSPLWDYGMPVESPDINTYLAVQMESFSKIAAILGLVGESEMWHRRKIALVRRMIKDMWDEEAGVFWALKDEEPIKVITPFNLYPLWTGELPESITNRLIDQLLDPSQFGGTYVIPTVARSDPHYDPQTMWRGPVWANINYFFIEALEKVGQIDFANRLMAQTLEMISEQRDMYEFYDAETGQPPQKSANIFGWTAAIFIDLAIRASQGEFQSGSLG